ncbi:MAG: serine hydrolase domain-containing protein [Bacteroidota bacterium]
MTNTMHIIKTTILGTLVLVSNYCIHGQESKNLDNYLNELHESHVIPGFSVVVVNKDGLIYQKGFGKKRLDALAPFTGKTVTAIGSLTKSMTAMGILQLVEQGILELDVPVVNYLPEFRTANKEMSDKVTVRMLINNTSGLQASPQPSYDLSDRALGKIVKDLKSTFITQEPGTLYEYSNLGFSVAGYLIGQVSGMTYKEFLNKRVFGPLGMKNTSTNPEIFTKMGALEGHYHGIEQAFPAIREKEFESGEYIPAGSFTRSNALDIGNYLIALLNNGRYGNVQVLSAESIREMWTPNTSFPGLTEAQGGDGKAIEYGLGWMISEIEGRKVIHHGGSTGKMSSMTMIDLTNNIGATVLANIDLTFIDQYQYPTLFNIVNNILRITEGKSATSFGRPTISDPSLNDFALGTESQKKYIGEYEQVKGGDFWVYFGLSLKIRNKGNKGLEALLSRGGNRINHVELDFVTPSLAIGRNMGIPPKIRFKLTPKGVVNGLFYSGAEFVRINEKKRKSYREVSIRELNFLVPKHWELVENPKGFVAWEPNNPNTRLKGVFADPIKSLKTEIDINRDQSPWYSERIGLNIWEHQSSGFSKKEETWIATTFLSKGNKLPISFEITTRSENHTGTLQKVLQPLLESIEVTEQ